MIEQNRPSRGAPLGTRFEWATQLVIVYSLVMFFVELQYSTTDNSKIGHPFFLWSERAVAGIFTAEYALRWWRAKDRLRHPFTLLALIDLAAILPFYLGFLVDVRSLRLIRTLRVLRLLKVYRYNRALQGFIDSFKELKTQAEVLGVAVLFFMVFSATTMYELERGAQPQVFASYSDALWWCITTLTTVGYGDKYPVTAGGRITATMTVVFGLGVFGTFISLIGKSFMHHIEADERQRSFTSRISRPDRRQRRRGTRAPGRRSRG
jgi:voltage-gated potassium channel